MSEMFIKAYCSRSKQYFGLRVEEIGGVGKVTDFYDIDSATARALGSTVDIQDLETAPNLRECFGNSCHNRRVGGCSCAKSKWNCREDQGYRYQCIYCKDLKIFSKEEGAEVVDEAHIGNKIRLAQGQEVEISGVGSAALEHILVGVGWDIAISGSSMDVDSSVFVKSSRTQESDLVYFGNLTHPSGCVVHMGDNLVGGKYSGNQNSEDSENINIYLTKVPEKYDQLYFVLNIYDCDNRKQDFGDVRNLYIRLKNGKTGQLLAEYTITQGMHSKTGMIIGKAYRKQDRWMFKAIGSAVKVSNVNALNDYCHD